MNHNANATQQRSCNESRDKCHQAKVSIVGLALWQCIGIDSWQIKGPRDLSSGSSSGLSQAFAEDAESNATPVNTKNGGTPTVT